jgi:predicted ATP-dependent protease
VYAVATVSPDEIRAIRGLRSRATFARLLGVTPLTVLRWELAESDKEARRPRAKTVETLKKLAVGEALSLPEGAESEEDEALLGPVLKRLWTTDWALAEAELLRLLTSTALSTTLGRTLATLGVAQAQLLRLDSMSGLMTLLPILAEAEADKLPAALAGRTFTLAACAFSLADPRTFDAGRANAYAARAGALLASGDHDLQVLVTTARLAATRFLAPSVALRAYESSDLTPHPGLSPIAQAIAVNMHTRVRNVNPGAAADGDPVLVLGEELGLHEFCLSLLASRAWRGLRGSLTPSAILPIVAQVREKAESYGIARGQSLVRALACEAEALARLGRLTAAFAAAERGLRLATQGASSPDELAAPLARLYLYAGRGAELGVLLGQFERAGIGARSSSACRAIAALAAAHDENFPLAAELADSVCSVPEGAGDADIILPDAFIIAIDARIQQRDVAGARAILDRLEVLLEERPSVWHTAFFRRLEALVLIQEQRTAEARQKLESSLATFSLIGDLVQSAYARLALARAEKAFGGRDADRLLAEAMAECERLGVVPRRLLLPAAIPTFTATAPAEWAGQTLADRLVVALERLSVQGLSPELVRHELGAAVAGLFPGRHVALEAAGESGSGLVAETFELAGKELRLDVTGEVDAAEREAVRTLAQAAAARIPGASAAEREAEIDDKIPWFVASARATRRLKREIAQLSRSAATVLITGESGSGKEIVARAVHELSARSHKAYVPFNCASVPRELFEGQLFGYRRGAFTGATSDNPGVIRAADGGTLFLDEIGELPLDMQPKLLRFLENGEIFPLGERKPLRVDVRVLAATHRDLGQLVAQGHFREDLYYRLNVVPLSVPPLRERPEDVLTLAGLFIERLAPEGAPAPELGPEAVNALTQHAWPGNVRELRNVIERAMAYAPVPAVLGAEHLRLAPARRATG